MSDQDIKDAVERESTRLERSGEIFTKRDLTTRLTKADLRVSTWIFEVFWGAYHHEVSKLWSKRATLAEIFGAGNVPKEHQRRRIGRFYAINAANQRRATRHMSADELAYVAANLTQKARANQEEAATVQIAVGIVAKRTYVLAT